MATGNISVCAHVLLPGAAGSREVGRARPLEFCCGPCPTFGDRWIPEVGRGSGQESWDDHVLLWPLIYCGFGAIADFVPGTA